MASALEQKETPNIETASNPLQASLSFNFKNGEASLMNTKICLAVCLPEEPICPYGWVRSALTYFCHPNVSTDLQLAGPDPIRGKNYGLPSLILPQRFDRPILISPLSRTKMSPVGPAARLAMTRRLSQKKLSASKLPRHQRTKKYR
jgi:hypothetical protein